jgi:hypothetical protein
MTKQRLGLTIFGGIAVISARLWLYLVRHMRLRNFGWFCLLTEPIRHWN